MKVIAAAAEAMPMLIPLPMEPLPMGRWDSRIQIPMLVPLPTMMPMRVSLVRPMLLPLPTVMPMGVSLDRSGYPWHRR